MNFDMIFCIVNSGDGNKALRIAKNRGVKGGTVFAGVGTVHNKYLEFLDMDDIKKEIVLMVAEREIALAAVEEIAAEMAFRKPHHGIAFIVHINGLFGSRTNESFYRNDRVVTYSVYNAIFTIVEKGRGDEVVAASKTAGARGATIIRARGSGVHETEFLPGLETDSEKDVVLIIAVDDICEDIISAISKKLKIDEPGAGVIFTLGVSDAYGLY